MTKSKPTSIRFLISVGLYNRLTDESKRSGVPMSELIRRALDRSLAKQASK